MIIRTFSQQDYLKTWQAMKDFTAARTSATEDEIWLLEHAPVFTQGQNGRPEHLLDSGDTPVIQTDRGGQITWHGPGQLMAYVLVDLQRKKWHVRQLVSALEQTIIRLLAKYNLLATAEPKAPGVYIEGKKICSIGLRIRRGCSYHGLALNLNPDLAAFQRIHPCGFADLTMTRLSDWVPHFDRKNVEQQLVDLLIKELVT